MTKYTVYDKQNREVGYTTNDAEFKQFTAAHPGYGWKTEGWPGPHKSTLPTLQEDPVKPDGDFLRQ